MIRQRNDETAETMTESDRTGVLSIDQGDSETGLLDAARATRQEVVMPPTGR